jgi:hypothetical protein
MVKDSKKNAGDMWQRGYIGESLRGDWSSGNLSEPIRKEYGEKRGEKH